MSNEENETYTKETSTMVAVFNRSGEIQELKLKGETYEGDGPFVHVPKSKLENVYLNEIPEEVGIYPVGKVVQKSKYGKEIHPLIFSIPLMTDVTIYNSYASIRMHGYTKYWYGMLGLSYYMDLLIESLRRLEKQNSEVRIEDFQNDGDIHYFLTFNVGLSSDLSVFEVIDKIREIFDLINNSLEEVMNSLRVFVEKRYVDFEQKIQEKWNETLTIPDSYKKGKVLEELLVLIFSTVEGFIPSHRIRTETEEIDISIRNESKDSFWSKFTPFVLIECKNWSTDCGKNEVVSFRSKLVNRFGLSHIGFLVSINGFRNTVTKEILRGSQTEFLVVPINGKMLKELVLSKDRSELLKSFVSESTFT